MAAAVSTSSPGLMPVAPSPGLRPFTVAEYHRLIETGLLGEDDPVELLEGRITYKMPRNPRHDAAIGLASEAVARRLPAGWFVRVQSAVTTPDSEPEPDLAVVRGSARDYVNRHPEPADVALVVEVADTSLTHEREVKGRLYARAGIPTYWLVNLTDGTVEVYARPTGPSPRPEYDQRDTVRAGQDATAQAPGGWTLSVPVVELVP